MSRILDAFREAYGADPPDKDRNRLQPDLYTPDKAAQELERYARRTLALFDIEVKVGMSRRNGRYATLNIASPNPLQFVEALAQEVVRLAGLHGVAVVVQNPSAEKDIVITFSWGTPPMD